MLVPFVQYLQKMLPDEQEQNLIELQRDAALAVLISVQSFIPHDNEAYVEVSEFLDAMPHTTIEHVNKMFFGQDEGAVEDLPF